MLDLEENKRLLLELQNRLTTDLSDALQISKLEQDFKKLEKQTLADDFWQDNDKSSSIFSKMSVIQKKIKTYNNLKDDLENLIELNDLLLIEKDLSLENDLEENTVRIQKELDDLEVQTLLSGKYDSNNAILTIHPGAGRN